MKNTGDLKEHRKFCSFIVMPAASELCLSVMYVLNLIVCKIFPLKLMVKFPTLDIFNDFSSHLRHFPQIFQSCDSCLCHISDCFSPPPKKKKKKKFRVKSCICHISIDFSFWTFSQIFLSCDFCLNISSDSEGIFPNISEL